MKQTPNTKSVHPLSQMSPRRRLAVGGFLTHFHSRLFGIGTSCGGPLHVDAQTQGEGVVEGGPLVFLFDRAAGRSGVRVGGRA